MSTLVVENRDRELYKQIGAYICSARRRESLSQEDLAKNLGMSRSSIANMERGEQVVHLHVLFRMAAVLRTPAADLLPDSADLGNSSGTLRDDDVLRQLQSLARQTVQS